MHPAGDENVYLLSGDVDVVLWTKGGEPTVRVSERGAFAVASRSTWHTALPHAPTQV
jgi:hypothetical protein